MSNLKLATVQVVSEILPHENADRLEIAVIKGWQCVVGKGEFKSGDICIYIQLDSIVPETEQFEFLRKHNFRVRTLKLRGKVSQGLVIPAIDDSPLGTDMTEVLGVEKYEKPIPVQLHEQVRGYFPSHLISKSDEERIQNIPELIDLLKGRRIYASLKHDGTSATFIKTIDGELFICGRNLNFILDVDNLYTQIEKKYKIFDKIPPGFAIQGEIVGPGLQKNHEGCPFHELRVFNVKDLCEMSMLGYDDMVDFCDDFSLPMVDLYHVGDFLEKWHTIDGLLAESDAARYANGAQAEGIVWRLADEEYCADLGKGVSFKVISNRFMLKHGE